MSETVRFTMAQDPSRKVRSLRGLIAAGVTIVCVVYLAWTARLPSLAEIARGVDYGLLGVAFVFGLFTIVCKAARWRILYLPEGRPGLGLAVTAIATGQVANWAAPARLGDVMRVGLASPVDFPGGDVKRRVAEGIGVLIAEKLLDGLMLLIAAAALVALGGLPDWVNALGLTTVGFGCSAGVTFALLFRGRWRDRWLGSRRYEDLRTALTRRAPRLVGYAEALSDGMSAWLSPSIASQAILWSAAAWGFGAAINYVVLRGMAISPRPEVVLAVLVALYGGAVIPSLPGRIGIFQYLCVLALSPFGIGFDQAFAFSLILYAVVYLPPIVLGLLPMLLAGKIALLFPRPSSFFGRRKGLG